MYIYIYCSYFIGCMEADLDWDATVESPYAVSYILDVEL